jgi:hypothetical protein
MATNTVQTVWKLILDQNAAREGESLIQRLARTIKDKLGGESRAAIDKTTEAIKEQTDALKKEEAQAKETAAATSKISVSDSAGKVGGAAGKLRGVGSLLGGGEALGLVNDIGDAVEGITELGGVLSGTLIPAMSGAAAALLPLAPILLPLAAAALAVGAAVKATVDGIQAELSRLSQALDAERSALEAAGSGATVSDAQAQIEEYNQTIETQTKILERNQGRVTEAFDELVQSKEGVLGVFADLSARLQVFFGLSKVGEFQQEVDKSKQSIDEATTSAKEWQEELDAGSFKADEAAKSESKLTESRANSAGATNDAAAAERKAQADQERAQQEAQRKAEQYAQKVQQIEEQRYKAAQKYGDALVDIARKSADDAIKASKALREKQTDNQRGFNQDISDITTNFHAGEMEEEIKRQEEEATTLRQHVLKLEGIRDAALLEETDLLRKRNFLGATSIRERANLQIEAENKTLVEGLDEKHRLQKQEDAQQLRELDKARRDRMTALQRANDEAKIAYQRDLANQRDARKIAEREALINRNRELRAANEAAQALLGIKQAQGKAELSIASQVLAGIRSMGNNTTINNNNSRTNNGGVHIGIGSSNPAQVERQVLGVLGRVGLV